MTADKVAKSQLIRLQMAFAVALPRLIDKAHELGYQVTLGEAYRSPEEARRLAQAGKGIINSLHCSRLAIDLHLFRGGKMLTKSEDYAALGRFWTSLSPLHRWGGDFKKPDGNHFSITYQGRA